MAVRITIFMLLVALTPNMAVAQPVTDDQTICFFFDEEATIRSYYGSGVFVGYIVVNPLWIEGQRAEALRRWTCVFSWEAEAGVIGNCDVWPLQGHPLEFDVTGGSVEVDVECFFPLAADGHTVIAMVGFHLTVPEPVSLFLEPGQFWADGSGPVPFAYLTSGPDGPMDITTHVANINGPAPVAVEKGTWGRIKLMYR